MTNETNSERKIEQYKRQHSYLKHDLAIIICSCCLLNYCSFTIFCLSLCHFLFLGYKWRRGRLAREIFILSFSFYYRKGRERRIEEERRRKRISPRILISLLFFVLSSFPILELNSTSNVFFFILASFFNFLFFFGT